MRLRLWTRTARAAFALATMALGGEIGRDCFGQVSAGAPAGLWTPLMQAIQATGTQGVPSIVVITSRSTPASQAFRSSLARAPEAMAIARSARFAEMPAEIYAAQVKTLGITTFPTVMVYRRSKTGVEVVAQRNDLSDIQQVFAWLGSLGLGAKAPAASPAGFLAASTTAPTDANDPSVVRTMFPHPTGQAAPSEQQPAPPPPAAPYVPPSPPPQAPYVPPPQPAYYPPPQPYVPAPAPYYIQAQTPAMVVQQAPQQIILAPPGPPQVTVAMAAPVSYAPAPAAAPPNLFTQPMQAPPAPQPMYAPPAPQPMYAPPAPQPMQAPPQYAPAPPQVAQAPTAMVLQAPGLMNSMIGTFGEYLARRRFPRVQMSAMPMLAQAPVANAPMALAPVTGYAPAGPPYAVMTPESTSFAPCNTYRAPCRYHGGPCPGPSGNAAPPPPPYPSASPQSGQSSGHGWFDWLHRGQ
jgi:hypothetical protein